MQRTVHIGPFGPGGPMFGRMFNGGSNWGYGLSRVLIMFLFLLFVGAIAYFIIRHFDHAQTHHHLHGAPTAGSPSADSAASDLLKMRFAKGEIDEDEFTRRMNLLKDHLSVS